MSLNRAGVVEMAEFIGGIPRTEALVDFVYRTSLAHTYDNEPDAQTRMAAYCVITAGVEAPAEYDLQLQRHDVVEKAKDEQQLIVVGKVDRDRTMLHAVIPIDSLQYSWEVKPEGWLHESPSIHTRSMVSTFPGYSWNHRLAHAYGYFLDADSDPVIDQKYVERFFEDGSPLLFGVHDSPQRGAVWFDNWLTFVTNNQWAIRAETEPRTDALHGVLALDSLSAAINAVKRSHSDQINLVSLIARAVTQAETGGEFTNERAFLRDSQTRQAGIDQFAQGEPVAQAILADLQILIDKAKTITPKTPAQAWQDAEKAAKKAQRKKARQIRDKLAALDITITEFGTEMGDGHAASLEELYDKAEAEGYFIHEFRFNEDGYDAAVGDKATLEAAGLNVDELRLGDLMVSSHPGSGPTRELAVQRALDSWHSRKMEKAENPFGTVSLYATAREGDYVAKVFIPDSPSQGLHATVEILAGDEETPHTSFTIEMKDAPVFEVSQRDKAAILDEVARFFVEQAETKE